MNSDDDLSALLADPEVSQAVLMDYFRHPRARGECGCPTHTGAGENPACGDQVRLAFRLEGDTIAAARFTGEGCAVSQASASLLAERLDGRGLEEARAVLQAGAAMLDETARPPRPSASLGRCAALAAIAGHPARRQCARVAWDTAARALFPAG